MASKTSAGILLYRVRAGRLEVLIAHLGGPFWERKDERAWSVVKGEYDEDEEDPLDAARREFAEETGSPPPPGPQRDLGEIRQANGKRVRVWAVEGDLDPDTVVSNTFTMMWPPRSGRFERFPEIDRAAWFDPATARRKLVRAQVSFIDRLESGLSQAAGT